MTDQTPVERAARELASQASGGVCQPSDPDITGGRRIWPDPEESDDDDA